MDLKVEKAFKTIANVNFIRRYGLTYDQCFKKIKDRLLDDCFSFSYYMGVGSIDFVITSDKKIRIRFNMNYNEDTTKEFNFTEKGFEEAFEWVDNKRLEVTKRYIRDILW